MLVARAGAAQRLPRASAPNNAFVSVIVPARDEARNLPRLLASLAAQTHGAREVIVIDGGGNGDLAAIAAQHGARVMQEPPLPRGWVGKSWACWNGRRVAHGEWLLFTDADTAYAPDALARAVAEAQRSRAGLLTGLTRQELGSFAERVVMPPVFTLIEAATRGGSEASLRDLQYAVANGQFLLFRASTYDELGGHEAVKGSVIEDLALSRVAARAGIASRFVSLDDVVRVRMYRGAREMFVGWRKNVASGAANTPPLAYAATVATHLAGLLSAPLAMVAAAMGAWNAAAMAAGAYFLMAARVRGQHALTDGPTRAHAALHPLGYAFFASVLVASTFDRATGRGALWKGRRYQV